MQFIPQYIERKHNPKLISYLDPAMEPILKQTYGILVYQDDLLIMAHEFAGYSWGEVDKFRKAVGKKIPAEMQKQKDKFIDGCVEHSKWPLKKAQQVWEWIEPFAAYGFNKAHSASYGRVAYQTAYLKANYPVEYLSALLTADSGDTEQISVFVNEAKRMQVPVLPPDVNESGTVFTVISRESTPAVGAPQGMLHRTRRGDDETRTEPFSSKKMAYPEAGVSNGAIRFGLSSIKNFGDGISESIIAERKAHGAYTSLSNFLSRVGSKNLNRKSLESLIKCGALDSLSADIGGRGTLLENIETLLAFHRDATATAPQESLFGAIVAPPVLSLPPGKPISLIDKLTWEKELLGIYVSGHPLDAHRELCAKAKFNIAKIKAEPKQGALLIIPVLVTVLRNILTKSGEKMAFITVEDTTDSIEAVVFPKLLKEHVSVVAPGACLLLKGKVSIRNGETTLAIEELKPL